MFKIYWHRLSQKIQKRITDWAIRKHKSYDWFMLWFKQPKWCTYPDAMEGMLGCMFLVGSTYSAEIDKQNFRITLEFCKDCKYCTHFRREK